MRPVLEVLAGIYYQATIVLGVPFLSSHYYYLGGGALAKAKSRLKFFRLLNERKCVRKRLNSFDTHQYSADRILSNGKYFSDE